MPEREVHDVPQHAWSDDQRLILVDRCEVVEEQAFTGQQSLQCFTNSAATAAFFASRCFDLEAGSHGDHGSHFAGNRFSVIQLQSRHGR